MGAESSAVEWTSSPFGFIDRDAPPDDPTPANPFSPPPPGNFLLAFKGGDDDALVPEEPDDRDLRFSDGRVVDAGTAFSLPLSLRVPFLAGRGGGLLARASI